MKMNSTKMMLIMIILTTMIMSISSNNFLMSWISMEINMISFLPIMTKSNKMKDQTMKYFVIQSLSSSMMLMSMLINSSIEAPLNSSIMMMSSMLIKLGLVPFHMWMPMVMNTLTWESCMIMSTIQKIIPIMISSQMLSMKTTLLSMMTSMIVAPMSIMKQLSMKKILALSSISNTPWMLTSMMNSKKQFIFFMTIYSTITIMMMNTLKKNNLMFINQTTNMEKTKKISLIIMCLSMSGFPPTTGFLPKWIILQSLTQISLSLMTTMILSSILMTLIYIKMMKTMLSASSSTMKSKKMKKKKNVSLIFNTMGMPIMLTLKSL